jgi:hypothetical protein
MMGIVAVENAKVRVEEGKVDRKLCLRTIQTSEGQTLSSPLCNHADRL